MRATPSCTGFFPFLCHVRSNLTLVLLLFRERAEFEVGSALHRKEYGVDNHSPFRRSHTDDSTTVLISSVCGGTVVSLVNYFSQHTFKGTLGQQSTH